MMVLVAVEELIDINPWHGLRFGNMDPVDEAGIERYYVAGSNYDVFVSSKHLEVRRDGRFLFGTDVPVEIRRVTFKDQRVSFELRAPRPVKLRVGDTAARDYPAGTSRGEAMWK
jgi:hypothetical protein